MKKWKIEDTKIWWAFFGQTDSYLSYCLKDCDYSEDTIRAKRSDLKMFWAYLLESGLTEQATLNVLSAKVLQSYLSSMVNKKLSPATIDRRLRTLQHFFNTLEKYHGFPSPIKKWPHVHVPLKPMPIISDPQIAEVMKALAQNTYRHLLLRTGFIMGLSMGLRSKKELTNIKKDQVDLKRKQILNLQRKGRKVQTIDFCDNAKKALEIFLIERDKLPFQSDYLLLREDGKTLTYGQLKYFFHPFGAQTHSWRRRHGTDFYNATMDILLTMQRLGQSDPKVTTRYVIREENVMPKTVQEVNSRIFNIN